MLVTVLTTFICKGIKMDGVDVYEDEDVAEIADPVLWRRRGKHEGCQDCTEDVIDDEYLEVLRKRRQDEVTVW